MTANKLTANSTTKYTLVEGNNGTDDTLDTNGYSLAPTSGVPITLTLGNAPAAGGIVITNSGTITASSARAIDVGSGAGGTSTTVTATGASITLNNSGTIQTSGTGKGDVFRVNYDMPQGKVVVTNTGTLKSTINSNDSQAIRLGKVYTASQITITNGSATASASANANALIQTNDADAIRAGGVDPTGSNTAFGYSVIANYGKIIAQDYDTAGSLSGVNAIDIGQGQAASVDNYGTIVGDESGLGSDVGYNGPPNYGVTGATLTFAATYNVTNELGGSITGNNGPAIAIGVPTGTTSTSTTSTITNYGSITGKATGTASANAAASIYAANGTGIYSAYAVTIVNGSASNATASITGSGYKTSTVTTNGVTTVYTPSAGQQGSTSTYYAINVANGTITNYGTIQETSAANAGAAINFTGSTASTLTNYGSIIGANGAAIRMGSGNDTVALYSGGTITGSIDGGAGNDTLSLNLGTSASTGTLSGVTNFETLSVNGGTWTIADAEAYASGVTIAAGATLVIGPNGSTGATITDNGTLAYTETGTFTKAEAITGSGKVVQAGTGTLVLSNAGNTYSGGTLLSSGMLDVRTAGAAGTGGITFGAGTQALVIEQAAFGSDGSFANTLTGVGSEDTIDLRGIGAATATSYNAATNTLTVTGGSQTVSLRLDPSSAPTAGYAYGVAADGNATAPGTLVTLDQIATVQNVSASPSSGYAKAGDTITFTITTSKAVSISGSTPTLILSNGGVATYDASHSTSTSLVFSTTIATGQDSSGVTIASVGNASSVQDAYQVPVDFSGATGHTAIGPTIDTTAPVVAITSGAGLTNQATQTVSGTVDATSNGTPDNGSTVSIYEVSNGTSTLLGNATVTNGTWSSTVNFSGNGQHTIVAQDTDAAGNLGTSGSVTYDLETTAPTVTITSAGGLTNQTAQTVTGYVDLAADPQAAGTTVTITDAASKAILGSGSLDSNGHFSIGVTISGDGSHTLQASDTDQAQNVGFATVNYTLDTTPPAAPTIVVSNDTGVSQTDNITSDPTVAVTPSSTGDSLLYSLDGSSYSATVPVLKTDGSQDGRHVISAEEQDAAGNASNPASVTLTLDTIAPTTAPSVALSNDTGSSASDRITNDPTISAAVGTQGDTLLYMADGATSYSTSAPVYKTDGTRDGTHNVTVAEEDTAGNIGPSTTLSFTLDTRPPAAPGVALSNDTGASSSDKITNDSSITYTASGSGDTLLYKADGATTFSSSAPVFATDGSQDGSHTISVEEVDRAGNVSAASSLTFTLDTTPPDIDFTSVGGTVNNATQTVNGFAGAENVGTTVSIYEDGSTAAVSTALVGADGYFSATVNLGADGTHTLNASDTDKAGNVGRTDTPVTYKVDSTIPTFAPGNLIISISGDGDGSGDYGDNQATPLVLRQITTDGTYVSQIVLPQTTTVVNGVTESAVSAEYGSSSEGSLQLSADGHSLVIAGYGINADTYNAGGASVYGNAALAQSTSIQGGTYTAVPRVIAQVNANGTIDTSTILYNVFNTNNPRSVATIDGSSFYISGQGVKGDTTQGLYLAGDGATAATSIDHSTDTRTAVIYNGQLYVSRDSKQGSGGTSNIAIYGPSLPTSATTPTILEAIDKSVTVTAANANTVNGSAAGSKVNLDPENFFFANATTLYVADGGIPKQGGVGDGGLQKWVYSGGQWSLQYTLSAGLGIVAPGASEGTTGLIGLTGRVDENTVELYATNQTVGDTDQKYVFGIVDSLNATTNAGQSFTTLVTADPDTNIRGISFAPTPLTPTVALTHDTGASATDGLTNDPSLTYAKARASDTLYYSVNGAAYATSVPTFATDGTYTVSVEEKDSGGNFGPASSVTFTLDTHAPSAPAAPTLDVGSDTGSSNQDGITADNTPTIVGTTEAGATVTLYDGGKVVGTTVADTSGSYSITSTKLTDGSHALGVTATDVAGNISGRSATTSVTIDTSAPATPAAPTLTAASDSGTSSTDGLTNDTTPTFSGTTEAGATVTLYEGTTVLGTAIAGSNGSYAITSTVLSEGPHALSVTATDAAGNVSTASAATSITIDTTAPAAPGAPTLTAASDTGISATDGITNDTTPTFTGSAEAGAIVTLYEGTVVLGSTVAKQDGSYAVTATALGAGPHNIRVTATDAAGNMSAGSATVSVVVDVTPPATPSAPGLSALSDSGSSSSDGITNVATPIFTGTAEAGATVTLYDGKTAVGTGMVGAGGTYAITSSTLADGSHAMGVTATDAAGNVSGLSAATSVSIDTTPPATPAAPTVIVASDTGISSTDGITNDRTPTVSGTAEAGSTVTVYDGATVLGTTTAANNGVYSLTATPLADGTHALKVTATDAAGNVSTASATTTVTIDTVAPSTPIAPILTIASDTGASSTDGITNVTTPTLTGSAEAGSTITLYEGKTVLGTTTVGSNGSYSVVSSALNDGSHVLTVTATDAAGNTSSPSAALNVTVDTKAPAVPATPALTAASDTGASSSDGVTNVTTPTFSGVAEANARIVLYDGTVAVGTAKAAADGSYVVTSSALANGAHTLSVTATDAAGNTSAKSAGRTITIDTSIPDAPSAPLLSAATDTGASATDGITKSASLVFTGTAAVGTTVTLLEGAKVLGTAVTAANGTYSISLAAQKGGVPALVDGSHVLTATAMTKAGKSSAASAATTIDVDTHAPATPATPTLAPTSDSGSSSADGITNVTTPTFTGTAEIGSTVTLYDGTRVVGTGVAQSNGTYAITAGKLTDGTHQMHVTATDVAGNVSATSVVRSIVIDTTADAAPAAPTLTTDTGRSSSDGITSDATPTFTGKVAAAGETVTLYDGSTVVGSVVAGAKGVYSVTATTLTDGVHAIKVTSTDAAGNVSAASAARSVTIDTTAPAVPAAPTLAAASDTGSSASDGITSDATPIFTGLAESNATVTLYDGAKVVGTALAGANGSYSVTASTLANGQHALSVTATDAAGNVSARSAATSVQIDTVAPAAPNISLAHDTGISAADRITNDPTLVYAAAEPGDALQYSINGKTWSDTAPTFAADGSADGVHTVYARSIDVAGNVGAAGGLRFTLDTTAPAVSISNEGGDVGSARQTITGRTTARTAVTLTENGNVIGTTTSSRRGIWSETVNLASGSNSLVASVSDVAGNVGSASIDLHYTPATAASAASLHSMVQAMSTMTPQSSAAMSPSPSAQAQEHTLAAGHG